MPPRHAYWTILVDDQPTAFRAHDAEELLPTLNRLREKNPTAVMKWFERGQLFDSRDAARDAGLGRGERRWEGPRPERDEPRDRRGDARNDRRARENTEPRRDHDRPRDKNWRPGGEHRDPRQKYRDAKKAKWNRFKQNIRDRHDARSADRDDFRPQRDSFRPPRDDFRPQHDDSRRQRNDFRPERDDFRPKRKPASSRPEYSPPHGDPLRRRERDDRRARDDRRQRDDREHDRPRFDRPFEERRGKPSRPHGDKLRSRPRDDDRRSTSREPARPKWGGPGARPKAKSWSNKPAGARKPFGSAPRKPFGSDRGKAFDSAPRKRFGSAQGKPFASGPGKWRSDRDDRPRRRRDEDE